MDLSSKSIDELWTLHTKISEILATKMHAEKAELERRLQALRGAADTSTKGRRPYPPVLPRYKNPDNPNQLWSGRGKRPHWVSEKLASGLGLQDLSIDRSRFPGNSRATATIAAHRHH